MAVLKQLPARCLRKLGLSYVTQLVRDLFKLFQYFRCAVWRFWERIVRFFDTWVNCLHVFSATRIMHIQLGKQAKVEVSR